MTWNNFATGPQRWMARFLAKRGWVCFYLDEAQRECRPGMCWMKEALDDQRRRETVQMQLLEMAKCV